MQSGKGRSYFLVTIVNTLHLQSEWNLCPEQSQSLWAGTVVSSEAFAGGVRSLNNNLHTSFFDMPTSKSMSPYMSSSSLPALKVRLVVGLLITKYPVRMNLENFLWFTISFMFYVLFSVGSKSCFVNTHYILEPSILEVSRDECATNQRNFFNPTIISWMYFLFAFAFLSGPPFSWRTFGVSRFLAARVNRIGTLLPPLPALVG